MLLNASRLSGEIEIDGETVRITDVLRDRENALSPEMIFPELSVCGVRGELADDSASPRLRCCRVTKTIHTGASRAAARG